MKRVDIHNELSNLGCSSEIHALVDDLDLDFGCPPLTFRLLKKSRRLSPALPIRLNNWNLLVEFQKRNRNYVHFAYNDNEKETGRLF